MADSEIIQELTKERKQKERLQVKVRELQRKLNKMDKQRIAMNKRLEKLLNENRSLKGVNGLAKGSHLLYV